jgi:hypothetical protein
MYRTFGITVLLIAGISTTTLGMLASRLASGDSDEGIRAIIVHGKLLDKPVVITDFDMATALHNEVARAMKYAEPYPKQKLQQRPCLEFAVFLPGSRTSRIPLHLLRPAQADLSWRYYPAVDDEPAVMSRVRISSAQVEALAGYGVPSRVARMKGLGC